MTAPSGNGPVFDLAAIRKQVGDKVFERGEAYFADGAVELSKLGEGEVRARVSGTEIYHVTLVLGQSRPVRRLTGDCSCPARIDFGLCKHMVATAFAVNATEERTILPAFERQLPKSLKSWLASQQKKTLVALILDLAESDERIDRKLELRALASPEAGSISSAAATLERHLSGLGRLARSYLDERAVRDWSQELMDVLDAVEPLIAPGCSRHVKPLIDKARDHAVTALNNGDDPYESLDAIFTKTEELSLKMRLKDRPKPVDLARELFGELLDRRAYRQVDLDSYWSLLGDKGLVELKRLAREAWPTVLPRRRGALLEDHVPSRHLLFQLLDRIAEHESDLEARIALRRETATSAFDIVRLVEFLVGEGRLSEALAAAEDAQFEFADAPDDRLTSLLADLYRRSGSPEKAEKLLWDRFAARPDMTGFQMLVGSSTGTAKKACEERAIQLLRERCTKARIAGKPRPFAAYDDPASLLLSILTSTRRYAEAWLLVRAERVPEERLKDLALASAQSHASDAIPVLRTLVERMLGTGVAGRYDEPLRCIDVIMKSTEGESRIEATRWLAEVRRDHFRKRNFIAGLEKRRFR